MPKRDLLQAAQNASPSRDRKSAAAHFANLVQADPTSEEGWLGLGLALEEKEKRIYCLRRALAINPDNFAAKQALESIEIEPKALPAVPPPPTEARATNERPGLVLATRREEEPPGPASEAAPSIDHVSETPAGAQHEAPAGTPPVEDEPISPKPPEKKEKNSLGCFFAVLVLVVLLSVGIFLVYFMGLLDPFLPQDFQSQVLFGSTTQQPLATSTPNVELLTVTPQPSATPTAVISLDYIPIFEESDCPFDIPGEGEIRCGYVIVPENRNRSTEDTIRLAVVEYEATGSSPRPEPVIFLQGGPGAGAVELSAQAYSLLVEPFLEKQTFITFDQRGTGLSEPILECDELTQVYSQDLRGLVEPEARNLVYLNAFRACNDLLNISGVDLVSYTTEQNAADVKDVLAALGYDQADIYGVSYGTRLAQVVMRDYAEIIRSVVLDSVLPLETNVYAASSQSAEDAMRTLFDGCSADVDCATAYPNLEADFWSLVDVLNASPISVPVIVPYTGGRAYVPVNGEMYLNQVMASLKQTWMIPGIPQSIAQIGSGDTTSLSFTLGFPPIDWDLDISLGMYISIMCHEYILGSDVETLTAGLEGRYDEGDLGWFPFVGEGEDYLRLCENWDAEPPEEGEDAPITSDIPTLVMAGRYDSITPPSFSQQVASHLQNSTYLEFPDQGHAPSAAANTDCPMQIVLSFLDSPETGPDSSCLADEEPPRFLLPFTGSEPIKFTTMELPGYSIRASVPEEWMDLGEGVFIRGLSGLDITQLNISRLVLTPPEVISILSERTFYGKMMLDSEPVLLGKQTLGAFTWELYSTTSFGTPVDMAMVNDNGTTLIVMLFCHTNEHDALRDALFLQVVSSIRSIE